MLTKAYHSVIAQNYHAFTSTSLWVKPLAQLVVKLVLKLIEESWVCVFFLGHSSYSSTCTFEFCNKMSKKPIIYVLRYAVME